MNTTSRGDWVTGEEIMQKGILPPDLGKACYEGILKAYVPELGDKRQIIEFSQLSCWPKYPSPLVRHRDYIKPASSPFWDWDEILEIPKLRHAISDIERQLGTTEGQGQHDKKLRAKYIALKKDLEIATQPNYNARTRAISDIEQTNAKNQLDADYEKYVLEVTWKLMKTEAVYLIDDIPIEESDLQSRAFHFYYETYEQYWKGECRKSGKKYSLLDFVDEYKNKLSRMWFLRTEVEKRLGYQFSEKHDVPELGDSQKTSGSRIPFSIDSNLWVGKNARTVFEEMCGIYSDEVIAYVLTTLVGETKTATGRLFYEADILTGKKEERDKSSYLKKIKVLLRDFHKKYTVNSMK